MNEQDNWDQHWDDFSLASSLNPANDYRKNLILNQMHAFKNSSFHLLDIGCGPGKLVSHLITHFPKAMITGIDMSEKGIELAKKTNPTVNFYAMNILTIKKIPDDLFNSVDVAICTEVLEHLDEPELFLKNAKKFLKNNGRMIITVPSGPRSAFDKHIGHRKHFTKNELKILIESAGFMVENVFKSGFPFFNLYKFLIILRGKRLISDSKKTSLSHIEKTIAKIFQMLFKFNLSNSLWGWQLIAVLKPRS